MTTSGEDRFAPAPRATWDVGEPLTVASCRAAFDAAVDHTVGAEEELMLLDAETFELVPAAADVLARCDRDGRFRPELRLAQIEIVTPVCLSAEGVERQLTAARTALAAAAGDDVVLAGAGTHPRSGDWGPITAGDRYAQIAELYPWAAKGPVPCGLHVHVAVSGADRALAVFNALRGYAPELTALAANSPFLEGRDTGLACIRATLNETYPRAGTAPVLESWERFVELVEWGRTTGSFPDASYVWWELRPHPLFGTIEFRMPDCQTSVPDAAAFVGLAQCLTARLAERYDAGEQLPAHDTFRISENGWSALRFGLTGWLVDLDTGETVPTRERLARLLDELEPVGARLGADAQLAQARALVAGNGAERQRYVAGRDGLHELERWLVRETAADARA